MEDDDRWQQSTDSGDDRPPQDGSLAQESNPGNTPQPADSGGLGRRELLAAGGLAAAAGGWYVFLRDDGAGGPVAVAEQSWQHWQDGDAEAYRSTYHSESPARDEPYWTSDDYWTDFGPGDGVELELVSTELVEQTDDRAVVEEVYRRTGPDAQAEAVTNNIELRTDNGEWKLWMIEFVSSDPIDESN